VHWFPPLPHFEAEGAVTQVFPSQQPLQFAGPQVTAMTHWPLKQF
jgi:hypothetical protein